MILAYDRELGEKLRPLLREGAYVAPPETAEAFEFRQAIQGAAARSAGDKGSREFLEAIKDAAEHEADSDYHTRVKADAARIAVEYLSLARPIQMAVLDMMAALKEKPGLFSSVEEGAAWIDQQAEFHRLELGERQFA